MVSHSTNFKFEKMWLRRANSDSNME